MTLKPAQGHLEGSNDLETIGQPVTEQICPTNDDLLLETTSLASSGEVQRVEQTATVSERISEPPRDQTFAENLLLQDPPQPNSGSATTATENRRSANAVVACTFCEQLFSKRIQLVQHLKQKHEERLPCCDICNRRFAFESTLRRHQETRHSDKAEGGRREECSHCGKTFPDMDRLQAHLFVHTGRE